MMIPKVYEGVGRFDSIEKPREHLEEVWEDLDENSIRDCIEPVMVTNGFRARLRAVIAAEGGHIESKFQ